MKNKFFGIILILGVVAVLFLAMHFIRVPYQVHSRGIVLPVVEWVLKKDGSGTLVSVFKNNLINSTTHFTVTEFQRGDLAEFSLKQGIFTSGKIAGGDTIGLIRSTEEEKRYVDLLAELQVQQSLLNVYLSGEKPEDVRMGYENMIKAEHEYETQRLVTERKEILFNEEYIPAEEYELSYNDLVASRQNLNVALANYDALLSGAKQEQIDYINATIHALEMQIEQAQKRMASFQITSPIDGVIVGRRSMNNGEDIVLTVADQSQLLVVLPVEVYQLPFLKNGGDVILKTNTYGLSFTAQIVGIDNTVQLVDRRQNVFVTAVLNERPEELLSGMVLDVTINAGSITIPEYLKRLFRIVYAN